MFAFTSFRGELGPGLEPVGTRFELAGSVTGGLFGLDVRQAGEACDAAVAVEHDRDAVTVLEGRVLVQLDGRSGASVAAVPVVELPGSDLHGLRQDCCVGPTSCHFISPCQVEFAYETNLAEVPPLSRVYTQFARNYHATTRSDFPHRVLPLTRARASKARPAVTQQYGVYPPTGAQHRSASWRRSLREPCDRRNVVEPRQGSGPGLVGRTSRTSTDPTPPRRGYQPRRISTAHVPGTSWAGSYSAAYLRNSYSGFVRIPISRSWEWNGVPTRNTFVDGKVIRP